MPRFAEAASETAQALQDDLDEATQDLRSARRRVAALELVVTHMAPAMQEALRLTSTAFAVHHALEVYQGGAPGTPVADLQRALGRTLMELRDMLEANLASPESRATPAPADEEE